MWGAVLGGVASGAIGALGSKSAADKQAKVAKKQLKFAKKQWKRQDALQGEMYDGQRRDIVDTRTAGRNELAASRANQTGYAGGLRDATLGLADVARAGNRAENRNALTSIGKTLRDGRDAGIGEVRGARDTSLSGIRGARNNAMGDVVDARDASIAGIRGARNNAMGDIVGARDASVAGFQPAMDIGNNALSAAAYNLGIGEAPKGYAGLGFTPGDQFLLEQGVQDIQGGAAGRGTLESGATLEALEKMRAGLAATRRDQSQAELFGLGQIGQSAAGNIANLRTGAASEIAGLRTGTAADMAGLRTGAANDLAALRTGAAGDMAGIRMGAAGDIADRYASTAAGLAGARSDYADRAMGINDADYARRAGAQAGYYGAMSGIDDAYTSGRLGLNQQYVSDMGTARTNRANLSGATGAAYGQNALAAMGNRGDAAAAGAVGVANAINNGINTGFGIYGYNRANQGNQPLAGTNMLSGNPLSSFGNWLGGMFNRPA